MQFSIGISGSRGFIFKNIQSQSDGIKQLTIHPWLYRPPSFRLCHAEFLRPPPPSAPRPCFSSRNRSTADAWWNVDRWATECILHAANAARIVFVNILLDIDKCVPRLISFPSLRIQSIVKRKWRPAEVSRFEKNNLFFFRILESWVFRLKHPYVRHKIEINLKQSFSIFDLYYWNFLRKSLQCRKFLLLNRETNFCADDFRSRYQLFVTEVWLKYKAKIRGGDTVERSRRKGLS